MDLPFAVSDECEADIVNIKMHRGGSNGNESGYGNSNSHLHHQQQQQQHQQQQQSPHSYQNVYQNVTMSNQRPMSSPSSNNGMNMRESTSTSTRTGPGTNTGNINGNGSGNGNGNGSGNSTSTSTVQHHQTIYSNTHSTAHSHNSPLKVALYDNVHPHFYSPKVVTSSSAGSGSMNMNTNNMNMNMHINGMSNMNMNMNGMSNTSGVRGVRKQQQQHNHQNQRQHQQQNYQQQQQQHQHRQPHYYNDQQSQSQSQSQQYHHHHHQAQQSILEIDDFVAIRESDAKEDSWSQGVGVIHHHQVPVYPYSPMDSKHQLSMSKTNNNDGKYGHQVDVLSLLLSSATAPQPNDEIGDEIGEVDGQNQSQSKGDTDGNSNRKVQNGTSYCTTNTNLSLVDLCSKASAAAGQASRDTKEGKIADAMKQHVLASTCYKDAAILLKREHQNSFNLLAFSLLGLSNVQARTAAALMKNGGISVMKQRREDESGSGAGVGKSRDTSDTGRSNKKGDKKHLVGREGRLRAKIRASMERGEADMTDSAFLGRADTSNVTHTSTAELSAAKNDGSNSPLVPSAGTQVPSRQSVNPVDDMMELEKELRDMDATFALGVNLSASTSSIATKNSYGEGSFCVVPGGSSYMSSSMMWTSGIGGRQGNQQTQNFQQHQHHHLGSTSARARGNRVQTLLNASTAGLQRSPSVGNHQQMNQQNYPKNHLGLESSWWGQASILASSTTSLSNSMVGIRSSNNGHRDSATAPANTKQLMRLLDSLKTLGDENASLLKEVEEAKKARVEAKAARETMRQFKEEYGKRFGTLKIALDKFRSEYPDQRGVDNSKVASNDVVGKSVFVRTNTATEMQKRDKMIQKLSDDLKRKDDALRKYENFYKEVKARSEQRKRQKEEQSRSGKN